MKKCFIFALVALLSVACSVTKPNEPQGGGSIPVSTLKIRETAGVAYSYKSENIGCSEVEFLKTFVGKRVKTEKGTMRVDNILEIHRNVSSSQSSILFIDGDKHFDCSFFGLAVEYEY